MKKAVRDIFLKLMFNTQKKYELHNDLPFLPWRKKLKKVEKLVTNLHDKTEYVIHKNFKTSTKSQINFEKSSQSDYI